MARKTKTSQQKLDDIIIEYEMDAEGENYHSMIPIYRQIADAVVKHADVETAIKVMKEIGNLKCAAVKPAWIGLNDNISHFAIFTILVNGHSLPAITNPAYDVISTTNFYGFVMTATEVTNEPKPMVVLLMPVRQPL